MNKSGVFILLLTVVWFALCSYWMCCKINNNCCPPTIEKISATYSGNETEPELSPIVFKIADSRPITSASFGNFAADLFLNRKEGEVLKITGLFMPEEKCDAPFVNTGFARAYACGNLFKDKISTSMLRFDAEQRNTLPAFSQNRCDAVRFSWEKNTDPVAVPVNSNIGLKNPPLDLSPKKAVLHLHL